MLAIRFASVGCCPNQKPVFPAPCRNSTSGANSVGVGFGSCSVPFDLMPCCRKRPAGLHVSQIRCAPSLFGVSEDSGTPVGASVLENIARQGTSGRELIGRVPQGFPLSEGMRLFTVERAHRPRGTPRRDDGSPRRRRPQMKSPNAHGSSGMWCSSDHRNGSYVSFEVLREQTCRGTCTCL